MTPNIQHLGLNAHRVLRLRKKDPDILASDIARRLNLSRERIRQILIKLELPTRVPTGSFRKCRECGEPLTSAKDRRRGKTRCSVCHVAYRINLWQEVRCAWCGTTITRLQSVLRHVRFFHACSRSCFHKFRRGKLFRNGKMHLLHNK